MIKRPLIAQGARHYRSGVGMQVKLLLVSSVWKITFRRISLVYSEQTLLHTTKFFIHLFILPLLWVVSLDIESRQNRKELENKPLVIQAYTEIWKPRISRQNEVCITTVKTVIGNWRIFAVKMKVIQLKDLYHWFSIRIFVWSLVCVWFFFQLVASSTPFDFKVLTDWLAFRLYYMW